MNAQSIKSGLTWGKPRSFLCCDPLPPAPPAKTSRWWVTTSLFANTHIVWYNSERGRFLLFIFHRKLTTKQTVYYYFQKLPIFVLTFFKNRVYSKSIWFVIFCVTKEFYFMLCKHWRDPYIAVPATFNGVLKCSIVKWPLRAFSSLKKKSKT